MIRKKVRSERFPPLSLGQLAELRRGTRSSRQHQTRAGQVDSTAREPGQPGDPVGASPAAAER
jgi:hypothetical protein